MGPTSVPSSVAGCPGCSAPSPRPSWTSGRQVVDYAYFSRALRTKEYDLDFGTMGPQTGFQGPRPPTHAYYGELWSQTQEYKTPQAPARRRPRRGWKRPSGDAD